jgi:hypothetical protein
MVLDAKAMGWAGRNGIDTAKLKRAHVPVYGKWYFPEIPPGVPVVNLHTGEVTTFREPMLAGEILFAREGDLRQAGLLPAQEAGTAEPASPPDESTRG